MARTYQTVRIRLGGRFQDAYIPPAIKQHFLHKRVFPIHGKHARYIAIESNPRTREMYAKFSIPCFWVTPEGTCLTEGTRIVKRL
jgi:hypothetical protein